MSREAANARLIGHIREFGWQCLRVSPREGDEGTPFTYTIGLTETLQHPELAIFGLSRDTSHAILSDCVNAIRNGTEYPIDTPVAGVVSGDWLVQFREVRPEKLDDYFGTAARYYGKKKFRVLIMFWQNKSRKFPWETDVESIQKEAMNVV